LALVGNNPKPTTCTPCKPLVHHKGFSWYLGVGLKPMPALHEMDLTDSQKQIFDHYGAKSSDWKKRE
jgi:hypothetical protein